MRAPSVSRGRTEAESPRDLKRFRREFSSSRQPSAFSGIFSRWPMPTFYELFRGCTERWPDNVALEIQRRDRVESYTYAEARRMAESIGRWLKEKGLQPGARIAILA